MSTEIAWTDETWNPVTGCTKVSAGCKNCYAEGVANRFWATQYPEVDGRPRRFTDVQMHADRLERPLRWTKPRMVFVNSMSDLFHEDLPDEFIDRVFAVMALSPRHTFQVLTKRPERMRAYLSKHDLTLRIWEQMLEIRMKLDGGPTIRMLPLPNVWLGVSVEDQATADDRIPLLLDTPAAVRWISLEPQLAPVDFHHPPLAGVGGSRSFLSRMDGGGLPNHERLDWVVQGGESGTKARAFYVQWAREVRDQCAAAGVPYFLKQLGLQVVGDAQEFGSARVMSTGVVAAQGASSRRIDRFRLDSSAGSDESEWPVDLRSCRAWPKVLA